jgi:hypothetical protein
VERHILEDELILPDTTQYNRWFRCLAILCATIGTTGVGIGHDDGSSCLSQQHLVLPTQVVVKVRFKLPLTAT